MAQDMLNTMVSEETWSSRKSKKYGTQSVKNKEVIARKRARQVDECEI